MEILKPFGPPIYKSNLRIKDIEKMWGLGTPEDLNYFFSNFDTQNI